MYSEEQKRRILDKCDIVHALFALNRSINPRVLEILRWTRAVVNNEIEGGISQAEFTLDVNMQMAEKHAGYKGTEEYLLKLGRSFRETRFELMNFPKFFIDSVLFRNYERVFPTWKKLQPHSLVHVDFDGEDKDVYLPEASLYEDMCFAFNQGWASKDHKPKAQLKAHVCYVRTSVISAYNFVESYLNGIAFDFLVTARRKVPQNDHDLLTEWYSKKQRQKYVNLSESDTQQKRASLHGKFLFVLGDSVVVHPVSRCDSP